MDDHPPGEDAAASVAIPEGLHQPLGLRGGLLALLLAVLWAGTSVTAREAVDRVPPLAVGGIRFALASIFMLAWCRWEGVPIRLRTVDIVPVTVLGTLLFLQIATFNIGVAWSNASHSTLLINTYVFWVAGAEHLLLKTLKLSARQIVGLIVAAAGATVLMFGSMQAGPPTGPGDAASAAGDAMLLLSAGLLAIKVLYTKRAVRTVPPGTLVLWHDLVGTLWFFAFSIPLETWHPQPFTLSITLSLLYAGLIVSGFCFAAHAWLLQRHSASEVSVFSFATPLVGVLLAIAFRGDPITGALLLSGALVALGIWLVNSRPARNAT